MKKILIKKILLNMEAPMSNIKCPKCGESYYMERYQVSTAMYYPPIYKNGININPDRNITTTVCQCLSCGKEFSFRMRGGEFLDD